MLPFTPDHTRFALVAFEGPDAYSFAGGLGTRVRGLSSCLAALGFETHLYFVGDPALPKDEPPRPGVPILHRRAQEISRSFPHGVYEGEEHKREALLRVLPAEIADLAAATSATGKRLVVLAEEWQTAALMIRLRGLLPPQPHTEAPVLVWNANSLYGSNRIPWRVLADCVAITAVSRSVAHHLRGFGVSAGVVPNGLPEISSVRLPLEPEAVRAALPNRKLLVKVARFEREKGWLPAVRTIAALKRARVPTLLLARGGNQPFGAEVWGTARALGLEVMEPDTVPLDTAAWRECLRAASTADIVHFPWVLDSGMLRMLYAASDAVLANSSFEPFGLAGLEAMDAGAVVLTGVTGEDYARPYENSLPVESEDAREMAALLGLLERDPAFAARLRREAQRTAAEYRWPRVVEGLLRRLEILSLCSGGDAASPGEGLGR